ncbi:Hypothetical protein CINCED_3A000056 [Cinara cedri]|uniref:Uncharacterized protein n=1 Tax=Cinara cedri TaxID=506608 RepID=A0A5E4MPL8_9HEMI|nr:Hypothetical protein CINCED_3A000056 [Cinara cedri]
MYICKQKLTITNEKNDSERSSINSVALPTVRGVAIKKRDCSPRRRSRWVVKKTSNLAPCDFFLFPKIKSALKGTRFESMEAVKQKTAELLKALTKEDFQHCFDQWKKSMEKCVARRGEYIEGEHLNVE